MIFPVRDADLDSEALAETELLKPDLFAPDDPRPAPPRARAEMSIESASDMLAEVDVVRVDVETKSAASTSGTGSPGDEALPDMSELLPELHELARDALSELLEWVRVRGRQHWLGVGVEAPPGLGYAEIVDLDANKMLPVRLRLRPYLVRRVAEDQVLSAERFEALLRSASESPRPPLADMLLADAAYYALHAKPTDLPRGLLIAAVACEVKIKHTLREIVRPESSAMLELLLDNPRDYSLAANALFDKAAKAVTGRSLREEDRPLFNRMSKLFSRRNKVAHHGELPSDEEALDSIFAAGEVFHWLRKLVEDTAQ